MIFLTVPHATCPQSNLYNTEFIHPCDKLALKSAKILKKIGGDDVQIFEGDIPRTTQDLNRERSRTTSYRKNLTESMKEQMPSYVLDIHSYPDSKTISFPKGSEIILLDNNAFEAEYYSMKLLNSLEADGIIAKLRKGAKTNDIQKEARNLKLRSILIEFNESLSEERLKYIARSIVDWSSKQ